ncbi:MAG: hypothetical protein J5I67_08645, partial [Ignavibacterium album]|nr:hypothetical protein [Ignavibacterium album]
GSFGVAILGSWLTRRVIFHTALFGEAANQNSPIFKQTVTNINHFVQQSTGSTGAEMLSRSKALIAQHIANQAFVQGIADDFFAAAFITLLIIIPLMFLSYKKSNYGEKVGILE